MIRLLPFETKLNIQQLAGLCLIVGFVGVAGLLWATRLGPGLSPDSVYYVAAARSLSNGGGLVAAVTNSVGQVTRFPPLYPAILAAGTLAGMSVQQSAVVLNGFLLVGLLSAMLAMLYLSGLKKPLAFIVLSVLVVASPVLFELYTMAWTEPLFIFLCYACLLCTIRYLGGGRRRIWLVGACVTASLATLTRYIGVVLPLSVAIGIVLLGSGSVRRRIMFSASLLMMGEAPLLAWWFRNEAVAGNATSRLLAVHLLGADEIKQAIGVVSSWFQVPTGEPGEVKLAALLGFIAITFFLIGPRAFFPKKGSGSSDLQSENGRLVISLVLLFVMLYSAGLALSMSFVDANTPIDDRILSPVFPAFALLLSYAVGIAPLPSRLHHLAKGLLSLALAVAVGLMLRGSLEWARASATEGIGFNQLRWRNSEVLGALSALPSNLGVYSNSPEAVFLYLDRSAMPLPSRVIRTIKQPNEAFGSEMVRLSGEVETGRSVVAYFSGLAPGSRPDLQELSSMSGPEMEVSYADGSLIGSPGVLGNDRSLRSPRQ